MIHQNATIHLPPVMWDEIVAHARSEAPRECCGIIAGHDGRLIRRYPLSNIEPGTTRYRIDDNELYRVYRELFEHGWDILAIYHSHPASPAYPSPTDVALAFWSEACYLICSLAEAGSPVIHAFRIVDEQIREVEVVTGEDTSSVAGHGYGPTT